MAFGTLGRLVSFLGYFSFLGLEMKANGFSFDIITTFIAEFVVSQIFLANELLLIIMLISPEKMFSFNELMKTNKTGLKNNNNNSDTDGDADDDDKDDDVNYDGYMYEENDDSGDDGDLSDESESDDDEDSGDDFIPPTKGNDEDDDDEDDDDDDDDSDDGDDDESDDDDDYDYEEDEEDEDLPPAKKRK
ncbi:PREDICTED: prostatic spermine-binding protein-like [Nicotiana attenuata]|uniref:prostatic spermine-binding protein-like n=1 Tax=Nicotiana attenuata TaxID=49451 RepID=UPI0009057810|nr:PREDICTED: prostatic spermine-binding protein-like [Nicotiana attenuata]